MSRLIAIAAGLALATANGLAMAQPDGPYTYELPTLYPAATAYWRESLPDQLRATAWLADFKGVSAPVHAVVVGDSAMLYAWACRPHDCDSNNVNLLMSADQKRVVGIVRLTTEGKKSPSGRLVRHTSTVIVGELSEVELSCLRGFDAIKGQWSARDTRC